jgi:hypothetical protein
MKKYKIVIGVALLIGCLGFLIPEAEARSRGFSGSRSSFGRSSGSRSSFGRSRSSSPRKSSAWGKSKSSSRKSSAWGGSSKTSKNKRSYGSSKGSSKPRTKYRNTKAQAYNKKSQARAKKHHAKAKKAASGNKDTWAKSKSSWSGANGGKYKGYKPTYGKKYSGRQRVIIQSNYYNTYGGRWYNDPYDHNMLWSFSSIWWFHHWSTIDHHHHNSDPRYLELKRKVEMMEMEKKVRNADYRDEGMEDSTAYSQGYMQAIKEGKVDPSKTVSLEADEAEKAYDKSNPVKTPPEDSGCGCTAAGKQVAKDKVSLLRILMSLF